MIIEPNLRPRGVLFVRRAQKLEETVQNNTALDLLPLELAGDVTNPDVWRPDIMTSANITSTTEAASAPLPDGEINTYHLRRKPKTISMTCMITDFTVTPSIDGVRGLQGISRKQAILAALQTWEDARSVFALVTNTTILENCFLSQVDIVRTPEDGSAFTVNLSVKEIQTFNERRLAAPNFDQLAADYGSELTSIGGLVEGPV